MITVGMEVVRCPCPPGCAYGITCTAISVGRVGVVKTVDGQGLVRVLWLSHTTTQGTKPRLLWWIPLHAVVPVQNDLPDNLWFE